MPLVVPCLGFTTTNLNYKNYSNEKLTHSYTHRILNAPFTELRQSTSIHAVHHLLLSGATSLYFQVCPEVDQDHGVCIFTHFKSAGVELMIFKAAAQAAEVGLGPFLTHICV